MPGRLVLYLGYLGLSLILILSLGGLTAMLRDILRQVPGLWPPLVAFQALLGAVYVIPGFLALALGIQGSPKALPVLKSVSLVALLSTFLLGLSLSAAGPDFVGNLAALARAIYPEATWLAGDQNELTRNMTAFIHFSGDLVIILNGAWFLYLSGSDEVKRFFQASPPYSPPELTTMAPEIRRGPRDIPGLHEGLMGVFFILLIYRGLSSVLGTVGVFIKTSGYSGSPLGDPDFLRFFFVNFSFYLVLSLVPPVAAIFGLGSLKKELERGQSAILIPLLAVTLFALFSLTSNIINLSLFYSDAVPLSYFLMIFLTPLFYAVGSIFFMVVVLRRRAKARSELAETNW